MAPTIEQLEAMSEAEVRAQNNQAAANTTLGLQWWSDERTDVVSESKSAA